MFVQCDDVQKHPEVQQEVRQDEDDEDHKGNTPEDCCSDSMSLSVKISQSGINNSSDKFLCVYFRVLQMLSVPGHRHVPGHREGLV